MFQIRLARSVRPEQDTVVAVDGLPSGFLVPRASTISDAGRPGVAGEPVTVTGGCEVGIRGLGWVSDVTGE
jgi:hypothetical protein